jgi:hypothetical protein
MAIRGIFASHSGIVGDRVNTLSGRVLRLDFGGTAPLLALSSGMKEERVMDTSYSWIEDAHISGNGAVGAGGELIGATTLTVVDAGIWTPNSILLVEATGEMLFITAVVSNTSITVLRGFAGTTAAAIPANGTLQLIGTAFEEGGGKPTPVMQAGESYVNYVQIFKNGWSVTGTVKAIQFLTGSKLAESKSQCAQFHAEDIERSFLWGRRSVTSRNNKEMRTSNGILAQVEDYGGLVQSAAYNSVSGAMSTAGIQEFMRIVFNRNAKGLPNERVAFTSTFVLNLVQQMVRKDTRYDLTVSDGEFGFKVVTLTFITNSLKLMTHPMMTENATWSKELYVLHPGLISKRVLRDTWTQEFTIGQNTNNGVDADEGFIADEMGFQLKGAPLCGIMRNIQTAAASV